KIQPSLFGPLRDVRNSIRILGDDVTLSGKILRTGVFPIFFQIVRGDFARQVTRPSAGLNLVLVPTDWIYDREKSGPPPIEPEACGVPGCSVHYFAAGGSSVLAFDRPGQEPIEFRSTPRFYLEGRSILDAEKQLGPLFVSEPPKLRHLNGGFASVHTVL